MITFNNFDSVTPFRNQGSTSCTNQQQLCGSLGTESRSNQLAGIQPIDIRVRRSDGLCIENMPRKLSAPNFVANLTRNKDSDSNKSLIPSSAFHPIMPSSSSFGRIRREPRLPYFEVHAVSDIPPSIHITTINAKKMAADDRSKEPSVNKSTETDSTKIRTVEINVTETKVIENETIDPTMQQDPKLNSSARSPVVRSKYPRRVKSRTSGGNLDVHRESDDSTSLQKLTFRKTFHIGEKLDGDVNNELVVNFSESEDSSRWGANMLRCRTKSDSSITQGSPTLSGSNQAPAQACLESSGGSSLFGSKAHLTSGNFRTTSKPRFLRWSIVREFSESNDRLQIEIGD